MTRLMQTLSIKDAKYGFGRLLELARAEPITLVKHGRPVVVVPSVKGVRAAEIAGRGGTGEAEGGSGLSGNASEGS